MHWLTAIAVANDLSGRGSRGYQTVTQEDLYLTVFSKLDDAVRPCAARRCLALSAYQFAAPAAPQNPPVPFKFMVASLVEYIRSLSHYGIAVEVRRCIAAAVCFWPGCFLCRC